MNAPDWKNKNIDLIKEACRHGEAKLAAQVQIATSADQRATVLAGIYVAAATGVIGAMATGDAFKHNMPLTIGSGVTALAFLVAAVLCVWATLPVDFWVPGNEPGKWYGDVEKNTPLEVAIGQQAEHFDEMIRGNNTVISHNAHFFRVGALLGIAAPVLGLLFGAALMCPLA